MEETKERATGTEKLVMVVLLVTLALTIFNQFQLFSLATNDGDIPTGLVFAQAAVIPTGVPNIYGKELNIRYDDVSANNPELADRTIEVIGQLDRTITLQGQDLERYIDIVSQISCEYCCGAQSIIVRREDVKDMEEKIQAAIASGQITEQQATKFIKNAGDAACGCAHSYAMRGLAKYLIKNHGNEFTDAEILEEMAKWKTLFFPTQMSAKADIMKQQNIEFSYANLGSNKYRGIEKGTSGSGMVGGC